MSVIVTKGKAIKKENVKKQAPVKEVKESKESKKKSE